MQNLKHANATLWRIITSIWSSACIIYCVRDDPLLRRAYQLLQLLLKVLRLAKSCFDCHFRCFDERNWASETAQHEYVLWPIASTDSIKAVLIIIQRLLLWSCFARYRHLSAYKYFASNDSWSSFLPVKARLMAVEAANMPVEAMDHLEHSK